MSQITQAQRHEISALIKAGHAAKEIYTQLGIKRSTYYAEIKRNANPSTGRYSASYANMCVDVRKERYGRPRKMTRETVALIEEKLRNDWSPEQIEGWCRKRGVKMVSAKWIYVHIEKDKKRGGDLWTHCRHKLKHRRRPVGARIPIRGRVSIDKRPAEACADNPGHWEMDTIVGPDNKGAILTLVERHSRFAIIARLEDGKNARALAKKAIRALLPYKELVKTITTDNGTEFAEHQTISRRLGADVYFAHPFSSWEKGAIENCNGLIRQYIPKKMPLNNITQEQLTEIQHRLNARPKKILGFETPLKIFALSLENCPS